MTESSEWWFEPFSIEVDGKPWAVKTDKVYLIGIQGESKLPTCQAPDETMADIQRILRLEPKKPQVASVESLREFLTGKEELVLVERVPLKAQLLLRIIEKVKKPEVSFWNASKQFHSGCLGLEAQPKLKAFLMGLVDVEGDPPAYPGPT